MAKAGNLGQALEAASKQGFTIYGATGMHADTQGAEQESVLDVFSATPRLPAILVLGSEEDGMRPGVRKRCDHLLGIPMLRDFDSLNVAQAGAIIIGCFSRHAPKKK